MRAASLVIPVMLAISVAASMVSAQIGNGRVRTGSAIYEEHCAGCHGLTGTGDGPDAQRLIVPPANLQTRRSRAKTEFELFTILAYGMAYSPMHGWRDRLSDEEMLEVIDYIRKIAPYDPAL